MKMISTLQEKQRLLVEFAKKNVYKRQIYEFLNSDEKLIGIIGSRGVGKTTLLLQFLAQFSIDEALYLSADDIAIADIGLVEIAKMFYKLGGRILVIDEVHMFSSWASHIKNIYDFYPDMKIRISGSSMLNIIMQSHDLSRRIILRELNHLSFREYLEIKNSFTFEKYSFEDILSHHKDISFELVKKHKNLYLEFKNYLQNGCYPYSIENKDTFDEKLFNSIEKIIYEDIPSTNKIKFENLSVFKKLIYKVTSSKVPYQSSIENMKKEFGISEPTLYMYLDILNKTGIFRNIKKHSKKPTKKPAKIYFKNTNILNSLSKNLGFTPEIGTIRECFFVDCFEDIYSSQIGDFQVQQYIFEVGSQKKSFEQIKDIKNSYLAIDTDTSTHNNKIPLWLFGFMR